LEKLGIAREHQLGHDGVWDEFIRETRHG
jgi:hypothetical protein